jgi:Amidohydrolase family
VREGGRNLKPGARILVGVFFWLLAPGSWLLYSQPLIIEHVTVIDATGAAPRQNVSVAIVDGRIQAIEKTLHVAHDARVIDGKGKFLIPGLWDMHMHLGPPAIFFPLLVANGIIGVREMFTGIPMPTIRAWRALPDAPRIVASGFLDGPPMLSNGPPPPGAFAVANAEQGRYAVHALAASGVDFLKIYSSVPRDAYFAIAQESRSIGIPFAGHVPEAVSPAEASDAGQRSEEHLNNILLACSTREDELRAERVRIMLSQEITGEQRMRWLAFPEIDDAYSEEKAANLFGKFVKNGTWQTPTLALLAGFAHARDDGVAHDPRRKYLLPAWNDQWDPRKTFFLRDMAPPQYDVLNAWIRALLARYQRLVGDMHRAGVEFLAGTDANGPNPVLIGFGLHEELALLVESGLTPMEALQTATRNPARYFGTAAAMGTVEAGKVADLVLLNADPLADIRNTQKIDSVIMRGHYYSRQDLDAMLARAEAAVR